MKRIKEECSWRIERSSKGEKRREPLEERGRQYELEMTR